MISPANYMCVYVVCLGGETLHNYLVNNVLILFDENCYVCWHKPAKSIGQIISNKNSFVLPDLQKKYVVN